MGLVVQDLGRCVESPADQVTTVSVLGRRQTVGRPGGRGMSPPTASTRRMRHITLPRGRQ